ncbi:MAG: O-antigen ligase domain-containing protein, partial [Pseudomonadota bacterium]|nr:O-antigen ligase domain-containing protein [Pseudomonadota bacterium]
MRGGNRPMPLLLLEGAGLLGLAALAWSQSQATFGRGLPATLRWGLAILVAVPLLQLIPMPPSWWLALPGRAAYGGVLDVAAAGGTWRPMTINARATEYAWLALIPCLAVFMIVLALTRRQVRSLALVFLVVAVCEALLGIVQVGAGRDSVFT